MTAQRDPSQRFSVRRWSRRKLEAKAAPAPVVPPAPVAPAAPELPPVESLTPDSDFAAFLRPEVDEQVKRAALKQLFRDPRFNVMDGLDTYIDDYTQADPIAPDVLADLMQRGFGSAAEAGGEPAPGVATARPGAAPAAGSSSATMEGPPSLSTPAQRAPSSASSDEGAPAQRMAEEADRTGTDQDERSA